jgi:hypothetical protein
MPADESWYVDGEQLGTVGEFLRLEALRVQIVKDAADMTAYNAAVEAAEALTEADYTADSWAALQTALTDNVVTEDNTQEEVDAATAAINEAADALVFENQEDLDNAKLAVADLTEADYTAESWAAIGTALALPETTNAEVGAKTLALGTAAADLVFAGQADLDAATAEAATKTEADYTVVTYAPLKAALELPETTNAEVVAKTAAITDAIAGLVEVANMDAYDTIVAAAGEVVEADYTAATYAALQTALEENVVTEQDTQAKVDEATAAINDAIDGLEMVTRISEVEVIKANQIQVTFNQPVDPTEATFVLKKGTSAVSLKTAVWNDDETVAVLERASSNFLAGDYVLTTSGLTDTALTNNITIAAQKVSSIEIIGDTLIKSATGDKATFKYVVKDQYATDITSTTTLTASASVGTQGSTTVDKTKATGTVVYDFTATTAPKTVVVTLVNTTTGVSTSKTLNVSDAAAVDTFELGDIVYPEGKTRIYENTASAAQIKYVALDQYDNVLTGDLTNAVNLISSDANIATFSFVAGTSTADPYIKVDTKDITTAKSVILTAVVTAKGTVTTKTLDVVLAPEPTTVEFGALSKDTVAVGDTAYLAVTVTDQFGDVMTPKAYIAAGLNLSGTGSLAGNGNVTLVATKTDANYGKIKLLPQAPASLSTIVSAVAGKSFSTTVDVQAARVLTEISKAPDANLIQGATAQLKYVFSDQFGEVISYDNLTARADTEYKITLTKVSGDDGAVTLVNPDATNEDETLLTDLRVQANASKTGKYNVTVELIETATENVLSSAVTPVTVTSNAADGLTYSVVDIPTLPAFGTVGITGDDPYAKIVQVKATDANGNVVTINPEQIVNVQLLNDTVYTQLSNGVVDGIIDAQDGYWVVGAKIPADADAPTNAKLRVTINTTAGAQVLESNVLTFNSAVPAAQELTIATNAVDQAVPTLKPTGEVSEFNFDVLTDATTGIEAYVNMKDQYGVWSSIDSSVIVNSPVSVIDMNGETFSFDVDDELFKLSDEPASYVADEAINLSIVKDGIVKTFTVTIGKTAVTAVAIPTGNDLKVGTELTAGALTPVGADVTYQWQVSTDGGTTYTNIAGATSSTYTLAAPVVATNQVRVVVTGTIGFTGTANSPAITVAAP